MLGSLGAARAQFHLTPFYCILGCAVEFGCVLWCKILAELMSGKDTALYHGVGSIWCGYFVSSSFNATSLMS